MPKCDLVRALLSVALAPLASSLGCAGSDGASVATAFPLRAAQAGLPAPTIAEITLNGPGCPDRDAIAIADDRATFRADFAGFEVEVGGGTREAELDCQIAVHLNAQDGVAYAPVGLQAVVTGESSRAMGGQVALSTRAQWAGSSEVSPTKRHLFAARGTTTRSVLDAAPHWSPCTGARALTLSTALRLSGRRATARLEELSAMRFEARACDPPVRPEMDAGAATVDAAAHVPDAAVAPVAPIAPVVPTAKIDDVRLLGPACTGSNAAVVSMAANNETFDVAFPGFDFPDATTLSTNCELWFDVIPPPGFRATVASFALDGDARVPADSKGRLEGLYWVSGRTDGLSSREFDYPGPSQTAFTTVADFSDGGLRFGDCQTTNMTVLLNAYLLPSKTSQAQLAIKRFHSLKLRLEPCP